MLAGALVACQAATASRPTAQPTPVHPDARVAKPAPQRHPDLRVAPLRHRVRADVLVVASRPLSARTVRRIDRLQHVAAATTIDVGKARIHGRTVHVVAADPSRFRRFAPAGTAEVTAVWQTLARGELVIAHDTAKRLRLELGSPMQVRTRRGTQTLRLGALATTLPNADVLVSLRQARALGLHRATGVVLSAGKSDPTALASAVRSVVGGHARIDLLTAPRLNPTAFLTGGAAASAFGAFSYRYFPDGSIQPDAGWVAGNIRSESVPLLGTITCHRLMFPQLRGALEEIAARGLAGAIHPSQYGGCYVPRFIERNPERSISLHTWGIAIDLNVPENGVGTTGHMDPRVVAIFKHWGFDWGGDWSRPDPMHFQIRALLNR
jgi:hypothetical protein